MSPFSAGSPEQRAKALVDQLESEADAEVRDAMGERYGIHVDKALGIPMKRLKALAKPLGPDHDLAAALWGTGSYEARTLAALIDDPTAVDEAQMNRWCADFDNWAIVDTTCFSLFDKAAPAWSMVAPWAESSEEFVRRAGFALLWALALHDREAPDERFVAALPLVATFAADDRPLVGKAITMSMRAIATKRPALTDDVVKIARRLVDGEDANARRVGRPIVKVFGS